MKTVMKIRRQILVDGKSIRSVNRETGISRNTIRKYLQENHRWLINVSKRLNNFNWIVAQPILCSSMSLIISDPSVSDAWPKAT